MSVQNSCLQCVCCTADKRPPARFQPRGAGRVMQGPRISRNGKPWNVGRQFFSSFNNDVPDSFIWADGVKAMEPEAQESFTQNMGLY